MARSDQMDKQRKLVDVLYQRTKDGLLDWKLTPVSERYQVSFANYSIQIGERENDYVIYLVDNEGDVADEFSDDDLGSGGYYSHMKEMHGLARRQARGVDNLLNAILSELEHPAQG